MSRRRDAQGFCVIFSGEELVSEDFFKKDVFIGKAEQQTERKGGREKGIERGERRGEREEGGEEREGEGVGRGEGRERVNE